MKFFTCLAFFITQLVAQAQEPIANIKVTATSMQVEKLFGPENLVSDEGLKDGKLASNGKSWHSGYIELGADERPLVQFDLGKIYTVGRFHLWNNNGRPSRGFHHVSMLTSDDGKTWKPLTQRFAFAKATGKDDYGGEDYAFKPRVKARFIRFICESTHRGGGQPDLAGLGKIRFYEAELTSAPLLDSQTGIYPQASGAINVKHAPYLAKGDGIADDTAAIQRAIDDWQGTRRTIVLPAGTYFITKPLRYEPAKGHGYNNVRGAGRDKTTLRLKDATFPDAAKPQPVLTLAFNGRPDGSGVHADWFNNNVSDLCVDVGKGNSGAIGLQFYSNNVGSLRNVSIRSGDGQGLIGLDLGYADQNGPCFIQHVDVEGFATGVSTGATVNSQTLEHITVKNASKVGWENRGQCLSIRGLKVKGGSPGFISHFGIVALIDSEFTGTAETRDIAAMSSGETLFARNITTKGFKMAIENRRKNDAPTPHAVEANVEEWVSSPPLTLYPTTKPRSLNLPIKETPTPAIEDPEAWVNVRTFRDMTDPDDTTSLQRAIDSGAKTIYFPAGGHFFFSKPIELRGKVERIVGLFAGIHGLKGPAKWKVGDGPKTLVIQDLIGELEIDHAGKRILVVLNGQGIGGTLSGGGDLYLENVVADWTFQNGNAWARQFNNEREGTHIINSGAVLWILGLKTERGGTLIETQAGATTELLGGLSYTTTKGKLAPMFVSSDAKVSYVIGEVCYSGEPFTRLVEERRGKDTKTLNRGDAPLRSAYLQGSQVPLFVGGK